MFKLLLLLAFPLSGFANQAQINLGERLFSDIRFSKPFVVNSGHDVNNDKVEGFSCLTCHQVDAQFDTSTGQGMRVYADHTQFTKIPLLVQDHKTHTLRNTPGLVGIGSPYMTQRFSHWDGEFADHAETVLGNMTGRNMGWLPQDKAKAVKNIIRVLKQDRGQGALAQDFGGSYRRVFLGVDPALPAELRLQARDRLDLESATDEQIIKKVIEFTTAFMNDLDFDRDEEDVYFGSAYDKFLVANNLPLKPKTGQSIAEYTGELRQAITKLQNPTYIKKTYYATHGKSFGFGPQEFEGMKVFFNVPRADGSFRKGMCIGCHRPPMFTDEKFHNVGTTQLEYDRLHGQGSFNQLNIPALSTRGDQYFLKRADKTDPQAVDLGVWNFFARKNKPEITKYMKQLHCVNPAELCSEEKVLPLTIAKFKTPTLRNLNHSAPYLHNGTSPHLFHLLHEYKRASELKRAGKLRNGAPQLNNMFLFHNEIHSLAPFMDSLNSDYE